MWSTVLDAFVRHSLVCEGSTVFASVSFLAHAHPISAISVVVAVIGALLPEASWTREAGVACTNTIDASAVTIATSLANALAIRAKSSFRALAAQSLSRSVHHLVLADSVPRAVVSAWILECTTRPVHPLLARDSSVLFVTVALAEILVACSVTNTGAVVGARILPDGAIHPLPLVVAEACSIMTDAVVVAVVGAVGHGAIES